MRCSNGRLSGKEAHMRKLPAQDQAALLPARLAVLLKYQERSDSVRSEAREISPGSMSSLF
jgi:hypothetical protein